MGRLALAVAVLATQLGPNDGFSFNAKPPSPAAGRLHRRGGSRGEMSLQLKSATTEEATDVLLEQRQDKGNSTSGRSSLLRRDAWPASKRRRVKGAIKRRARRLARVRRKNKAAQEALALEADAEALNINDVARIANSTYFPVPQMDDGRAPMAPPAATPAVRSASGQAERAATAAQSVAVALSNSKPGSEKDASSVESTPSAVAAKGRSKKKHRTIKGRTIAKGGKGRGVWRSIFGPTPLLEVRSIEQLSHLVDVEGWGLEDLSVLTGDSGGARSAERAASPITGAATAVPAELDSPTLNGTSGRGSGRAGEGSKTEPSSSGSDDDGNQRAAGASQAGETAAPPQPPPPPLHPSLQAVLDRAAAGTKPSEHGDGRRIGLAIEGGGMRGCVAAGMASCLHYLGLADSFDCVYGASAGSLIGAYFVSRQSNGTAVYHDVLPTAGSRFIDMAKFPQALGFEMPKVPRKFSSGGGGARRALSGEELRALEAARAASFARVIGLDFLLEDVVGRVHALDFDAFSANDNLQPLHVVASGVSSMSTVSLASKKGHFSTLDELTGCIRASMLVPGLAGPLISVPTRRPGSPTVAAGEIGPSSSANGVASGSYDRDIGTAASTPMGGESREESVGGSIMGFDVGGGSARETASTQAGSALLGQAWQAEGGDLNGVAASGDVRGSAAAAVEEAAAAAAAVASAAFESSDQQEEGRGDATELLVDAMVFEPLPYRSAIEDGCTDVVVLCTRPKGSQVLGKKPSLYETRVVRKFFDQHDDPATTSEISEYVQQLQHLRVYAEDALVLGEGTRTGVAQPAPKGGAGQGREAFMLAVAPASSCKEVSQLEMDRRVILQGCRDGFAGCYDMFVGAAASSAATSFADVGAVEGGAGEKSERGEDVDGRARRSGAEVALEYFPDSLLSCPADLEAPFMESGRFISDLEQQRPPSSVATPAGESSGSRSSGSAANVGRGEGGRDGRRFVQSWLRRDNARRGAAATTASMDVAGGVSAASPLKSSTSVGSRGLLRRLLSRTKLRRSLEASSARAAAVATAPAPFVAAPAAAVASSSAAPAASAPAGATAPASPAEAAVMADAECISVGDGVDSAL